MLRKKIITVTMTLICALAGVGAIGMSASAAEEANTATARSTCHLVAEVARSGADVKFTGGRVGCATNATVRARRDIPLSPDQNLDTRTFNAKNSTQTMTVRDTAGHKYFTETTSSTGATAQSSRLTF